ncbi:uncharacterized protein L201_003263 [Kwoniella dendrophila CBS 6074]|uniref:Uncharacterized protein n=1 Tax=Kwoniella dendrophila CBS 6074 TaxID=1295534 RepID=A0AAX4JTY2_9TREE
MNDKPNGKVLRGTFQIGPDGLPELFDKQGTSKQSDQSVASTQSEVGSPMEYHGLLSYSRRSTSDWEDRRASESQSDQAGSKEFSGHLGFFRPPPHKSTQSDMGETTKPEQSTKSVGSDHLDRSDTTIAATASGSDDRSTAPSSVKKGKKKYKPVNITYNSVAGSK